MKSMARSPPPISQYKEKPTESFLGGRALEIY